MIISVKNNHPNPCNKCAYFKELEEHNQVIGECTNLNHGILDDAGTRPNQVLVNSGGNCSKWTRATVDNIP